MALFSLTRTCQREAWLDGAEDAHGNSVPAWASPSSVACNWWPPDAQDASSEPLLAPTGGDRVLCDLVLVVSSSQSVDHRDRFVVGGRRFEVFGLPKDYNNGPWLSPGLLIVQLKAVV